jgi:hypothetical protein
MITSACVLTIQWSGWLSWLERWSHSFAMRGVEDSLPSKGREFESHARQLLLRLLVSTHVCHGHLSFFYSWFGGEVGAAED